MGREKLASMKRHSRVIVVGEWDLMVRVISEDSEKDEN